MVRLAGLPGADDPEDIAQEAFTRLMNREPSLGDAAAGGPRWSRLSRFLIPAAAAAAVVAIAVAALGLGDVLGRPADGPTGATPSSPGPDAPSSPAGPARSVPPSFLTDYPPVSAVLTMPVTGPGGQRAVAYSWLAYTNSSWWPDQLQGLQSCGGVVYRNGDSTWHCMPLPQLGTGRPASITLSQHSGARMGPLVLQGLAVSRVASVTAVLPDGQVIPGAVTTGRGFPGKAWAVVAPADDKTWQPASGARLVFRDASGAVVASLGAVAPSHGQVPEPASGGIAVFTNPEGSGPVRYTMYAYLIKGYVGFWLRPSPGINGYLAPRLAAGPPALAGFTLAPTDLYRASRPEAVGYAHADVARVVRHLPGGRSVSVSTSAAWLGTTPRVRPSRASR